MKLAQISFPLLEDIASPNFRGADIGDIVSKFILYLFPFAGLVMLLYLIYGGYKYMLSRGDPKALADAKGTITTALIGFIIVFVAFWLVQLVGKILGINAITSIFGGVGGGGAPTPGPCVNCPACSCSMCPSPCIP